MALIDRRKNNVPWTPHRAKRNHLFSSRTRTFWRMILLFGGLFILIYIAVNQYYISTSASDKSFETAMSLLITQNDNHDHEDHNTIGKGYHVIFSTDCSAFQHWQSYLLFHSAYKVNQPGTITRIASGCSKEEIEAENAWHEEHITKVFGKNFLIHFAPEVDDVVDENGNSIIDDDYSYFNKPFGVKHWIENVIGFAKNGKEATGTLNHEDDIVILIDPDMVLLRPITGDFSNEKDVIFTHKDRNRTKLKVEHGSPFAQKYLVGVYWQEMNLDKITKNPNSAAKSVNKEDGLLFYQVGAPYIATMRDTYQIVLKWCEYGPRVYVQYPELLAEMYAYCIAAADIELPHTLVESLMVSNVEARGEGWPMVDALNTDRICEISKQIVTGDESVQSFSVPSVIHFCQQYFLANWFFSKYRSPTNIFECDSPLFKEPPNNLKATQIDWAVTPNKKRHELDPEEAKRYAFMICALTAAVNEAITFFKKQHCNQS